MKAKKLECRFLEREIVLRIEHIYCQNPKMINKVKDSTKLICIGKERCNCRQYNEYME